MLKINEDKTDRWADRVIYNRTRRSYICRARIVVARQKTNSTILPTTVLLILPIVNTAVKHPELSERLRQKILLTL